MRRFDWRLGLSRETWAWASYDFANSVFATTIIAGFFPVFLDQYWRGDLSHGQAFALLAWVNAGVAIVIALCVPVLGAIADCGNHRKRFLAGFLALGVAASALLALPDKGNLDAALILFGLGSLGFLAGNVFYDALLPHVAPRPHFDRASTLGYALGYLGGGILFAINVTMVQKPEWFGLVDAGAAVKASFVTVAVWWGLFALVLFAGVHEGGGAAGLRRAVGQGLLQFRRIVLRLRTLPLLLGFLVVYWLYIDGVNSVFKLAVGFGLAVGLPSSGLIVALLVTQFVAFPAALAYGWIGERVGPRAAISAGLLVYIFVVVYAAFITRIWQFFLLAVLVGLVQGGVQALSRSLYARLIPREESAAFFGFFGLMGKFAAVFGPLIVAGVQTWTGSPRLAVAAIGVLFVIGLAGLWMLPLGRAAMNAKAGSGA
ncbi:MAG: MFS transporter [Gammaproteobacteria bacterium]|nr:MFS transporter [Gammaproteobacteria bacterium]